MAIIGIDFGTTSSKAAVCIDGLARIIYLDGEPTLPSVVSIQRDGKVAVGTIARQRQAEFPQDTADVKRHLGDTAKLSLGQRLFAPEEVAAMILAKIKELAEAELGEPVTGAVIACPAYFTDLQRSAIVDGAATAGIEVLRIINEPTCAYLAQHDWDETDKLCLIYDLGGGTLDVTVIRATGDAIETVCCGGDLHLGGKNFDNRIVDWMIQHITENHPAYVATMTNEQRATLSLRLERVAEEGKLTLCSMPGANPTHQFRITQVDTFQNEPISFYEELSRLEFEKMTEDLLRKSLACVDDVLQALEVKSNLTEKDITEVLLVGGGAQLPRVRTLIEERFPNTSIWGGEMGRSPSEVVARGASIVAARMTYCETQEDEVANLVLCNVTSHTLGVIILDDETGREELVPVVPRESLVPCQGSVDLDIRRHGQGICRIRVYQGDGSKISTLCELAFEIVPSHGSTPLQVDFRLDADGCLVVRLVGERFRQEVTCQLHQPAVGSVPSVPPPPRHNAHQERESKKAEIGAPVGSALPHESSPLKRYQFSAFYPERISATEVGRLVAVAHLEAVASRVAKDAANQLDLPPGIVLKAATTSQQVPRDQALRVSADVPGLTFDNSEMRMSLWQDAQSVQFRFRVDPKRIGGVCRGWVHFWIDAIALADVPVAIFVAEADVPEMFREALREVNARPYRRVFPSYSHQDAEIVERLETYASSFGDEYLRDVSRLRAGQVWSEQLLQFIRSADVFQLFWSDNAATSTYVEGEWRSALAERARRQDDYFVRPVYWGETLANIPNELSGLHFARVPL